MKQLSKNLFYLAFFKLGLKDWEANQLEMVMTHLPK